MVTAGSRQASYMPNPAPTPQSQLAFDLATNHLAESQSDAIRYDSAGNLIVDAAGNTFTFDLENRQTSYNGTTVTYSYDGEGRRVREVEPSGTAIYVYNVLGQLVAEYGDLAPPGIGGTSYFTMDHLGSTRVVTDGGGGIKKRYDYLPFGEEIPCDKGGRCDVFGYSSTDYTRQRFTGKERDAESGLDNFKARYFGSSMGRFSSPDPLMILRQKLTDPQQWNMYAYVRNNPVGFIDPTGMYLCNGTAQECKNFEKARREALKSKDRDAVRAAKAYGDPDKDNGVHVGFAKELKGGSRWNRHST